MARKDLRADELNEDLIDLSYVPGVVTIKNEGKVRRSINISGWSQSLPIEPGQTVKLVANTSSELIGFLSLEDNDLQVTLPTCRCGEEE